jgi:hypothetical protein
MYVTCMNDPFPTVRSLCALSNYGQQVNATQDTHGEDQAAGRINGMLMAISFSGDKYHYNPLLELARYDNLYLTIL